MQVFEAWREANLLAVTALFDSGWRERRRSEGPVIARPLTGLGSPFSLQEKTTDLAVFERDADDEIIAAVLECDFP